MQNDSSDAALAKKDWTSFGEMIQHKRRALGLTQAELAARVGCATVTIKKIEQEQRKPSREMAIPDSLQALTELGPNLLNVLLPLPALVRRIAPYLSGPMDAFERLRMSERSRANLEQDQVLEELTQVLSRVAARRPLLMLLDDLQWVDDASLNVLFHLGRRLAHSRILLVGAFRPGENGAAPGADQPETTGPHPIETLMLELARQYGDIQIDLNQAGPSAGKAFIDALLDREPNRLEAAFRDDLYRRTLDQPLFTVEMLRSMQESGRLVRDGEGRWVESAAALPEPLPARVEAVIEQRLWRLKPALREVLDAASVQGEQFAAELVAGMLGLVPRGVQRSLSGELSQQHRLVQEQGEAQLGVERITRFQFRHLLFQEYIYDRLSLGEKKRLHRAAAAGLETLGFGVGSGQSWDAAMRIAMYAEGGLDRCIFTKTRLARPMPISYWRAVTWSLATSCAPKCIWNLPSNIIGAPG
jgi:predicted ATPase